MLCDWEENMIFWWELYQHMMWQLNQSDHQQIYIKCLRRTFRCPFALRKLHVAMLIDKNFQNCSLIGWHLCCQPIKNHVRKLWLKWIIETNMDFNRWKCRTTIANEVWMSYGSFRLIIFVRCGGNKVSLLENVAKMDCWEFCRSTKLCHCGLPWLIQIKITLFILKKLGHAPKHLRKIHWVLF